MKLVENVQRGWQALKEAERIGFQTQQDKDRQTAQYLMRGESPPVNQRDIYGLWTATAHPKYRTLKKGHPLRIVYSIGVLRAKAIPIEHYTKK